MVDLSLLVDKLNEELGYDKFVVFLNTDVYNLDLGDRDAIIVNVARIPMGYTTEEFDAESIELTLTFDVPVDVDGEDLVKRDLAISIIKTKLLGKREYTIVDEDTHYNATCFFEQLPSGAPYLDEGRVTQQIVVKGQCLLQNANCGAVVGNSVKININGDNLLKVSRTSSTQYGSENNIPLSEDSVQVEVENISRASIKTFTFIYTGKEIEKEFIRIAEGYPENINKLYSININYGEGLATQSTVKLLSAAILDEPGVYLRYTITMQVVNTELM